MQNNTMQKENDTKFVGNESFVDMYENSLVDIANRTEGDNIFVVAYSTEIKITFVIIACISLTASMTAITLMHRSKRTPYAVKFLSTGLLTFDALFIVMSTVRKFITNPIVGIHAQYAVMLLIQSAYFTIGLMSVERYFVILKPMEYINVVTKSYVRRVVLLIWLSEICLCLFVRYGLCYIWFRTDLVFTAPRLCFPIITIFYGILIFFILAISFICYIRIFKRVLTKSRQVNVASMPVRSYRSTSLVFVYLIVIVVSSIAYGVILLLARFDNLRETKLRLSLEFVSIFNCIFDPFLYVLWFKECRLQLLTFLALFLKRYRDRARRMRIEVYDIVTINMRE